MVVLNTNMFVRVYENKDFSDEEPVAIPVEQIWTIEKDTTKVRTIDKTYWIKENVKSMLISMLYFLGTPVGSDGSDASNESAGSDPSCAKYYPVRQIDEVRGNRVKLYHEDEFMSIDPSVLDVLIME